jgi:hypothetical protein
LASAGGGQLREGPARVYFDASLHAFALGGRA